MPAALFDAVRRARFKQVTLLLNKKANINVKDDGGRCLLMAALQIEHEQKRARMFEYLLKRGAPTLTRDADGKGLLEWAVKLRRLEQIKLILDQALVSYNLTQRDGDGYTSLHYAAMSGDAAIAALIVDAFRRQNVSVDVPDSMGLTPLMQAQRLAFPDVVAILTQAGGSVGRSDFTYHLNMRQWERRGREEKLAEKRRAALREISRLKISGKPCEASTKLWQLRLRDGGTNDAGGGRADDAADFAWNARGGCSTERSVADSGAAEGDASLASSWQAPRLARFLSYRSVASDGSNIPGNADSASATSLGTLPTILEAFVYQKTGSYRSPAVIGLIAAKGPKSMTKAVVATNAAAAKPGRNNETGKRNVIADEFKIQLPPLNELQERPAAAAAPVQSES